MVRNLFFIILGFVLSSGAMAAEIRFRTEFMKKSFYEGESIATHFVVYAEEERIDVEVMRFPEFRGFWSENFVLKQGPLQLLPALMQSLTFPNGFPSLMPQKVFPLIPKAKVVEQNKEFGHLSRAVVGSYTLHGMIGRKDSMIRPMKLQVRRPMLGTDAELEMESELDALEIKPLPEVPKGDIPFLRAVGNFDLKVDSNEILFRPGEASVFRVILVGDGNFAEVNNIPLKFPDTVKVMSTRAYSGNTGGVQSKVFEYSLEVSGEETRGVAEQSFFYFDPNVGQYALLKTPPLQIAPMPKEAVSEKPRLVFNPQEEWSRALRLEDFSFFWWLQAAISVAFGSVFCRRGYRSYLTGRQVSRGGKRRWMEIKQRLAEGHSEDFLRQSIELLIHLLEKGQTRTYQTVPIHEWVRKTGHLSENEKREIQFFIEVYGAVVYGKKGLPEGATERISRVMQEMLKKVA